MKRQIEPGCLAIIINANYPGNIGREVEVLNREDMESQKMGQNVWDVRSTKSPLVVRTDDVTMNSEESYTALVLERNLMRIDGGLFLGLDIDEEDHLHRVYPTEVK